MLMSKNALRGLVVVTSAFSGLGIASADQTEGSATTGSPTTTGAASVTPEQAQEMQQMVATAKLDIAKIEQGAASVRAQYVQAQEKRDVVKTVGLNDSLTKIDAALKQAKEHMVALENAVKNNDLATARQEFAWVQSAANLARTAVEEASSVVGQDGKFSDSSSATVEIAGNVAQVDPVSNPNPDGTNLPSTSDGSNPTVSQGTTVGIPDVGVVAGPSVASPTR